MLNPHIVYSKLFLSILPSQLSHTHLDELLKSGGHVNILIL